MQSRRRLLGVMETYNPWSIVHLVFSHLASQGLHPVLGETGDPGAPAADLLRAFGIAPAVEGKTEPIRDELARLRAAFEVSQVETAPGGAPRCDPGHEEFRV